MLFHSFQFSLFLPIVFAVYWMIPHKYRWAMILVASCYFYMSWNPRYIILFLGTTVVSYSAGLLLDGEIRRSRRQLILASAVVICLGVLFFYKYFNFFSGSVVRILRVFSLQLNPITLKLLLPVGISFYTFQTLGYVIDVYRGDVKAERHFGYYAAFISFFPQLVAGPIERTGNLLPQIKNRHIFDYQQASYGAKLMAWGYFKKLVIADTLSQYVSKVYDSPQQFRGFALVLATVFFAFQIYCDFSGYSDIAIGTAKLLGIDLMTNFKSSYFSQSMKEFWGRWHISLSTWFRDYLYIPLGGSRKGKFRHFRNLMTIFLVSGLWHGANWTFVVWGGIHGILQVIEDSMNFQKVHSGKILWWVRVLIVFVLCSGAWIFFAADSVEDACYVIAHMLDGISNPIRYCRDGFAGIGMGKGVLVQQFISISILAVFDYISIKKDVIAEISQKKIGVRWVSYILLCIIIIFFSQKGIAAEFVYFQF